MVLAMLLGGLRRCEVLGLRLEDCGLAERRVFVAEGKGGHQRVVPIANRFFTAVGDYLHDERPDRRDDGSGVRRVEGTSTRPAAVRWKASMRSSPALADGPGWNTAPAISCATPV